MATGTIEQFLINLHENESYRKRFISSLVTIIERNKTSVEASEDFVNTITHNIRNKRKIRENRYSRLVEVLSKKPIPKFTEFVDGFTWKHVIPQELTAFAMDNNLTIDHVEAVCEIRDFDNEKRSFIMNVCEEAYLFDHDKYEKDDICEELGL